MEDILNYNKREQLYKWLIDDFGLTKVEERYNDKAFGNFFITLSASDFLAKYVNDRSYLTIIIASHTEPSKWYDLSFIKDYIYNPDNINSEDQPDNNIRIEELNSFLKKDFYLISDLFNKENYADTRRKIDKLLKDKFIKDHPGMI